MWTDRVTVDVLCLEFVCLQCIVCKVWADKGAVDAPCLESICLQCSECNVCESTKVQ